MPSARKSLFLAVVLQSVPLLAAGGCVANAASDQEAPLVPLIFWWSTLFWGLGYFYLRRYTRFAISIVLGPILATAACSAAFETTTYYDWDDTTPREVRTANDASMLTAMAVFVLTLVTITDAVVIKRAEEPSPPTM